VGGEWKPANASNALWWSPDFFAGYCCGAGSLVDQAFSATAAAGLTAARVWLHDMAYDADPQAFLKNIDAFLAVAAKHKVGVGFVFFDDCWAHTGASTSVQCTPTPGVHNGCSMAAPQDVARTNITRFKSYVSDTITAHKSDARVLWWGLFNEPRASKGSFSATLRHAAYGWAKEIDPNPALVTSLWTCSEGGGLCGPGELNQDSDLHNIHTYDTNFAGWTAQINQGMAAKRPSIITEAGCTVRVLTMGSAVLGLASSGCDCARFSTEDVTFEECH
jgi:hypothetical protein